MKPPNFEQATIADAKLVDYLLSTDHPVGKYKAAWFAGFGFSRDDPPELGAALARHAVEHEVVERRDMRFGVHYTVEGALATPDRREPVVRSVWLIAAGEQSPRFVTAFPGRLGT